MKNELLRRLYYGEIHPWERTAPPGAGEQELNQRIDKSIQMLRSFMRTEEVATLEQLLGDIDFLKAEETVQAFTDVRGQVLYSVHNSTFALAMHGWRDPLDRLVALSEQRNIALATPEIGEVLTVGQQRSNALWWKNLR